MSEADDGGKGNAQATYNNIVAMVAALQCDYERLEELKQEPADERTLSSLEAEELAELQEAAGECKDQDDAREVIEQDPLSVEVREPWHAVNDSRENPCEFRILLSTGGPPCQIMGELGEHQEPTRAWLEYQDWGTPWTQLFDTDQTVLLAYCSVFYFGE